MSKSNDSALFALVMSIKEDSKYTRDQQYKIQENMSQIKEDVATLSEKLKSIDDVKRGVDNLDGRVLSLEKDRDMVKTVITLFTFTFGAIGAYIANKWLGILHFMGIK